MHDIDVLHDESDHSTVNVSHETPGEQLPNHMDEAEDVNSRTDVEANPVQPLPTATHSGDVNIPEPTLHHISIKLAGQCGLYFVLFTNRTLASVSTMFIILIINSMSLM